MRVMLTINNNDVGAILYGVRGTAGPVSGILYVAPPELYVFSGRIIVPNTLDVIDPNIFLRGR